MTTVALLLAVAALVGALVVGTTQARDKADKQAQADAQQELASAFWPAGFKRVSAAATTCGVEPPSICLFTPAATKDAAAELATRLASPSFQPGAESSAPSTYTVAGTLTRGGTAVVATVEPHVDEKTSTKKQTKYAGSDVVVRLQDQPS